MTIEAIVGTANEYYQIDINATEAKDHISTMLTYESMGLFTPEEVAALNTALTVLNRIQSKASQTKCIDYIKSKGGQQ